MQKQPAPYTKDIDRSKWERNYRERYISCRGHMCPERYPGFEYDPSGNVIERHTGYTPCGSEEEA